MDRNTIIELTRETARRLGHGECAVVVLEENATNYDDGEGAGLRMIPRWGVRVTREDKKSTRINFDTVPEHSEDRVKNQIAELLGQAVWK